MTSLRMGKHQVVIRLVNASLEVALKLGSQPIGERDRPTAAP
jgi:hypothetical protein